MFCPECGAKNADNAGFCEKCGAKLQQTGAPLSHSIKKEKKPLDAKDKMILIELGVMIIAIIIFIVVYNVQFSAKNVAEKYMKAVEEEDYSKLYDTLLIDKSGDYMTKEAFVTAMTLNESEDDEEWKTTSITKRSGGFSSQRFRVRYDLGETSDKMDLKLKRKGLFWKVEADNYIYKKYKIAVPEGAVVTVDKIPVSEKASHEIEGMDTYTLSPMFGAVHYVEVSGDEMEKVGRIVSSYEDEYAVVQSDYNEKTLKKVSEQAVEDWKEIVSGAASGKRFSDIAVLKDMGEAQKEYTIDEYESVRDYDFEGDSSSTTMNKYTLSNAETRTRTIDSDGNTLIEVEINGSFTYGETSSYWGYEEDNGQCVHYLRYFKDGEDWKLYSMDLSMFYD